MAAKDHIPAALRQQVWRQYSGDTFQHKCFVTWCKNKMNVFDFHVGHNIPESKGGGTEISNLRPICASCNLSMGNRYTIDTWSQEYQRRHRRHRFKCLCVKFMF